jgi:hypothetical protein
LGNLAEGDSSAKLEKLINKWFLGLDRPVAEYGPPGDMQPLNYEFVQGPLFKDGISYADIDQGMLGDCYFLAALGSIAKQSPSMIQNMFIDNGDNTFTVRFYLNGAAHYLTVDRFLPVFGDGDDSGAFAQFGTDKDDPTNELWVALAEKAYAQLNESLYGTNSYQAIGNGGIPVVPMSYLTGWDVKFAHMYSDADPSTTTFTSDQIINKLNSGKLLTLDTPANPPNSSLIGPHSYVIVGYDATTSKFKLFNPHGINSIGESGLVDLTWSEIVANFVNWSYT